MALITDTVAKELMVGITGKYIHGSQLSFGLVEIKSGTVMPVHQHVHEQITYIISGELKMQIDNKEYILTAGSYHVIASGILHGAEALTDCTLIDVFSPVREDYKIA